MVTCAQENGNGDLKVRPRSVNEGETIEVTGPPGSTVYYAVEGSNAPPEPIQLGPDGRERVQVPPTGGKKLVVFDDQLPPSTVEVTVISQG